jgi:hypothetical protein
MASGSQQSQPSEPTVTEEQRTVAAEIDQEVAKLVEQGYDDLTIFGKMAEHGLPRFKWLVDTTTLDGLNALCSEFGGLAHYAQLLERITRSMLSDAPDGPE